jgi:hypothetical protein
VSLYVTKLLNRYGQCLYVPAKCVRLNTLDLALLLLHKWSLDPIRYILPIIKAIRKYISQGEGLSLLGYYPVALGKL